MDINYGKLVELRVLRKKKSLTVQLKKCSTKLNLLIPFLKVIDFYRKHMKLQLQCYFYIKHIKYYHYVYIYIIVIDMCLYEDGEEVNLLTLPLSSFVKPALQKWSYKAKVSTSEKLWHCTCLLQLQDALNSHRLNVGMDLISQPKFCKSCIKIMARELKSGPSKLSSN